jgi:predicted RNA binding protein YcfA (HicA-like mRNA interferase family)
MPALDAKKTLKNLKSKGFVHAKSKSVDHNWIEFWHNGKLTRARTKISHGEKELDSFLISCMSKQTCLSKNEFMDLANCPMSQDTYENILRAKGYID